MTRQQSGVLAIVRDVFVFVRQGKEAAYDGSCLKLDSAADQMCPQNYFFRSRFAI